MSDAPPPYTDAPPPYTDHDPSPSAPTMTAVPVRPAAFCSVPTAENSMGLSAKLKQLEEAEAAGLMTAQELATARQRAIDGFIGFSEAGAPEPGPAAPRAAAAGATPTAPTPSHGNPASSSALNSELNNVARNTDDTAKARSLVAAGADLTSTNGRQWRHTPLHQAAYHGRFEMAKALVELGAPLELHSNACGRGAHGTPLELARGGGHSRIVALLETALKAAGREVQGLIATKDIEGCWV